jgi:hypothetical protein
MIIGLPVALKLVSIVQFAAVYTVSFAGHTIDGLVVSSIVMNCVQVLILPQLSVAVKVLKYVAGSITSC